MAFNIGKANPFSGNGGYGLGDYGGLHPQGSGRIINSYAQVTNITASTPDNFNKVTIGATYLTTNEKWPAPFATNTEVLVHVAAINKSGVAEDVRRGRWQVCRITGRSSTTTSNGLVLTLNKNLKKNFLDSGNGFEGLYIQLVSIPNFKDVILDSGCSITCHVFSAGNGYGGVVAFKSSGTLTFSGGHIDVAEKGIQSSDATALWSNSRVPKEDCTNNIGYKFVGWENYRAVYHLPLNYPGGVAFIMAQSLVCDDDHKSRIGYVGGAGVIRMRSTKARGIIVGDRLTISNSGVLSANDQSYTLPTASASTKGGIKIGKGLTMTGETLSANADNYTLPTASSSQLGGVKVGNTLSMSSSGVLNYNLPNATSAALGGVIAGNTLTITNGTLNYNLPTASASQLGGVKVGSGLTITNGVLSANATDLPVAGDEEISSIIQKYFAYTVVGGD